MNRIDKLIIKAKEAIRPGLELAVAIIEQNGDSWTAQAHLSDGHGTTHPSGHLCHAGRRCGTYPCLVAEVSQQPGCAGHHRRFRRVILWQSV